MRKILISCSKHVAFLLNQIQFTKNSKTCWIVWFLFWFLLRRVLSCFRRILLHSLGRKIMMDTDLDNVTKPYEYWTVCSKRLKLRPALHRPTSWITAFQQFFSFYGVSMVWQSQTCFFVYKCGLQTSYGPWLFLDDRWKLPSPISPRVDYFFTVFFAF